MRCPAITPEGRSSFGSESYQAKHGQRRAVNPDHAEGTRRHVLPKDDAEAVVEIMRAAAVLPPLYDEHDDVGD